MASVVLILLFIPGIRLILRNWSVAYLDEKGLTLPTGNASQPATPIAWEDIRALYSVAVDSQFWLLLTTEHLYAWQVSPTDFRQGGTKLANAIIARTGLPNHDATTLCQLAISSNVPKVPDTLASALFARWQPALDNAKSHDERQMSSLTPAILLAAAGVIMSLAATFLMSQAAAGWLQHP